MSLMGAVDKETLPESNQKLQDLSNLIMQHLVDAEAYEGMQPGDMCSGCRGWGITDFCKTLTCHLARKLPTVGILPLCG
jgi:hypothetical protein